MTTRYETYEITRPLLGMFPDLHMRDVPPQGFYLTDQFHIQDGHISKYLGWRDWSKIAIPVENEDPATSVAENFNFGYDIDIDGSRYLIVGTKKYLYLWPHSGSIEEALNDTAFTGALTDRWQCAELNNKLYITNGVDKIQVFDGTTLTDLTGDAPSAAKFAVNSVNHLFVANTYEGTDYMERRVRWSDIDDPATWTPDPDNNEAGYVDMPSDIGSKIEAIGSLGPNGVAIYGNKAIYMANYIGGAPFYAFERKIIGEGLFAPYSLVGINDRHFFLGNKDFYVYNGGSDLQPLGANRVISYFFGDYDRTEPANIYGFAHPLYTEVWWVYVSKNDSTGFFSKALTYNWQSDTWAVRNYFPFSMLVTALSTEQRQIQDVTTAIKDAVGTWRDKQGKGQWVLISGN